MAQYNLNGFNRSPYNIKPEYNVNWITAILMEHVTGSFGTASEDYLSINANEKVTFTGVGAPNRYRQASGTETVSASAVSSSLFLVDLTLAENVTWTPAYPSLIARPTAEFAENVDSQDHLGIDVNLAATMAENVDVDAWVGFLQDLTAEGYELISSVAGAEAVSEYVCNLDVTLQPGSTIVIDANNYNVLIDGENAIWTQSGDWLDNLNRETISIEIQAASGGSGLSATILYTERYL